MEKKNIKVLIVDDDKFLLGMYSLKFANNGYDVDTTVGSVLALDKLRAGAKPDIILLDIIMPNMTGLELLKAVRADAKFAHLPFLMVTAEAEKENIIEAVKAGVSNYIVKPFTGQALKDKLDKIDLTIKKQNAAK